MVSGVTFILNPRFELHFFSNLLKDNAKLIKHVLLAEAQHRRQHSTFGWVYKSGII